MSSMRIATIAVTVSLSVHLASAEAFKDTKNYKTEPLGFLNKQFDTYASMNAKCNGTDADWVFVSPEYNFQELQKSKIQYFARDVVSNNFIVGIWDNNVLGAFENQSRNLGLQLIRSSEVGATTAQAPSKVELAKLQHQMAMRAIAQKNPEMFEQVIEGEYLRATVGVEGQIETDLYNQDKEKLGLEEAIKKARERKATKRAEIRSRLLGDSDDLNKLKSDASKVEEPKRPEELSGYVLVAYVVSQTDNNGSFLSSISGVSKETTTGEIILLKDGKPQLAARTCAANVRFFAGVGGKQSAAKCGEALATAFNVKP